MPADADPRPPGVGARWSRARASAWFAVATGMVLFVAAYVAVRTGLATTSIGGFAEGDEPNPRPAGLTTGAILLGGAGLAWAATMRRVAVAGAVAAAVLLGTLAAPRSAVVTWTAVAVAGIGAGAAAVAFRWHARSVHWRRRRAALVAIVLAVGAALATGNILAVLALVVVLPLAAASAALLLEDDDRR